MSSNNRDKDMPSVIQWDGTSGDPFKEWKRAILDTGAERTDESGSSVADVFTGADMGGTAVEPLACTRVSGNPEGNQRVPSTLRFRKFPGKPEGVWCSILFLSSFPRETREFP